MRSNFRDVLVINIATYHVRGGCKHRLNFWNGSSKYETAVGMELLGVGVPVTSRMDGGRPLGLGCGSHPQPAGKALSLEHQVGSTQHTDASGNGE